MIAAGTAAPDFDCDSSTGPIHLKELQGAPVVLYFYPDPVPAQQKFATNCGLPFPLIADVSKKITESYGVLGPSGRARRISFFIDSKGTVVEVVESNAALQHPDAAVRRFLGPDAVARLAPNRSP
ncbi:MAG: redoxin domain-containing protein [Thermoplasmata archaeon]|nr:redoxin domain-containing protein [Thermoplasmata archaeon]